MKNKEGWDGKMRMEPKAVITNPEALEDSDYSDPDAPPVEEIEADEDLLADEDVNVENQISRINFPPNVAASLTELDLYDNLISHIKGLEEFHNLTSLDLSFNKIKHIKNISHLKKLTEIFFVQNKISRIEGLEELTAIKNLELGANKIREIENLETLTALEELWLGKNKIVEMKNLDNLSNLRIISIQSNRLTKITGLSALPKLEELYLSHNAVTDLSGLESNETLRVLDFSNNQVSHLEHLSSLKNLEELWGSNNQLASFEEVERELKDKEKLQTVYFEGNPLQLNGPAVYRNKGHLTHNIPAQDMRINLIFMRTRTLYKCSLALLVSFVNVGYGHGCTGYWCGTCLPAKVHDAPGVGFDLTPSYGTAVVHYYNGTVVEIAKVLGSPEYLELMARLATTSKPSTDSTLDFMSELQPSLLEYLLPDVSSPWRDWWRRLNTKLGRPVKADDVEIISDLLHGLKVCTEKTISQPLDRVAITDPGFQSLSTATINAALRMLDLRTWVGDSGYYTRRLVEGDAVYAASGYGLCPEYQDLFYCIDKFAETPDRTMFFVSYNRNILYTSIAEALTSEALSRLTSVEAQLVDYELGLDRLLEKDEAALWDRLRSQLQILPREYEDTITHLLLAGESATHPRFLAILRDSMTEILPGPVNIELAMDPTFAAARGAALYARRRQEVQSDCVEESECEEMRMHERLYTST
ncbi:hypothetical protein PENNAL_c0094G02519 [Penicillium nalgiovense]|uniref:Protein phosphatase 1 regulatory subunit 7 n=1 Tax=Penicillium nalgiovense TaxID=60175 RepID=A0A1V6XBW2_PENNA|nr:hypothetical protein PENNAL_c0094G02519 [Penicillium nalgiovense]